MRIPTGVRTPVAIMSMRARAGAVQALVQPGSRTASSSAATSSASCAASRRARAAAAASLSGRGAQPEYQRRRAISRPLGARAQADDRLGHRVRRRIGAGVGAADLAEHRLDLAELAHGVVLPVELERRLLGRHAGQRGRHVEQIALVDARQELAAQARDDRQRRDQRQRRRRQRERRPPEREVHERPVEADQRAGERVVELGDDAPAQQAIAQRRRQRQRHERRREHHEGLGDGQRPQQPPGLARRTRAPAGTTAR